VRDMAGCTAPVCEAQPKCQFNECLRFDTEVLSSQLS
jgi:hypothetical protein